MKSKFNYFKTISTRLKEPLPYLFNLKNVLFISLVLGGIQVFIIFFLEPHGTENYQVPFRNLKLSGFALCFILPFVGHYTLESRIVNMQNGWRVYHEIISKSILSLSISTASYFYNRLIINSIPLSIESWVNHQLLFSWPYLILMIPLILIIYYYLLKNYTPISEKLIIKGQNQEDLVKLDKSQFIYAESDQNYVKIFFRDHNTVKQHMIRSSLQNIENQISDGVRIHRSYLINPEYLKTIEGNKRKRIAYLEHITEPLPVSPGFNNETN